MCLFMSGFSHLVECLRGSSTWEHVSELHSFRRPNNTPSCGYAMSYLSSHQGDGSDFIYFFDVRCLAFSIIPRQNKFPHPSFFSFLS